jgi:hypothetical protein
MSEFYFYINTEEREIILEALLNGHGFKITPARNYPTQSPIFFEKPSSELIANFNINPCCYLSGYFSTHPIRMTRLKSGSYAGTYVVTENEGGPILSLRLRASHFENELEMLSPSCLSYPSYLLNNNLQKIPQTEELKSAFMTARRLIKKYCKPIRVLKTSWIGRKAHEDFITGKSAILSNGVWIKASGETVRNNK